MCCYFQGMSTNVTHSNPLNLARLKCTAGEGFWGRRNQRPTWDSQTDERLSLRRGSPVQRRTARRTREVVMSSRSYELSYVFTICEGHQLNSLHRKRFGRGSIRACPTTRPCVVGST